MVYPMRPEQQGAFPPKAPTHTVGIRELKQNPSEIIAKAASGVRFEVLSNGKPVGVVIQRERNLRSRWVGTDALAALTAAALPGTGREGTGWAAELRAERGVDNDRDRIVDPWETRAGQPSVDKSRAETEGPAKP